MSKVEATDFTRFVDDLAATLVDHSPTFEAFVVAMPGVLPDEALAALRRMPGSNAQRLAADAVTDRAAATIDQCNLLPLPHPLDAEFRFDEITATILATALVESTLDGDEILLIGVPSVAISLAAMHVHRRIRFLGPDNCVTAAVVAAFAGRPLLLDQGSGGTAAAALLDPPWYAEPMADLIRVCAAGCREGALIKLVIPPLGTRPEIALDRATFLSVAAAAGLVPTGVDGPVCYRTPLFELAALEQQGIARLPSWRRGEVVEFRASGNPGRQTWSAPVVTEFSVAGARLRLVPGANGSASLVPITSQEVFPSVSSRTPGRSLATLWTTTNRAFSVDYDLAHRAFSAMAANPEVLHLGFYPSKNDLSVDPRVASTDELIHQLIQLIGRETGDARRLVGEGAWLETEMEWRS